TGKTILNNDLFLAELRRVRRIADNEGVDLPQYILGGASLGTLAKNVLIELTNKYGLDFQMDKYNRFKLFGVLVCCT
ncbi:PBSX family phage terminase large subunit, partial [Bacillus thuringiensis]|nr:PBSX family phage terminase large subunit [Bacillus thuringiensis]